MYYKRKMHIHANTPFAMVSRDHKTLRVLTTATDSANLDVSSKEGAVLSKRKFHH
jgi:hypothetical protein